MVKVSSDVLTMYSEGQKIVFLHEPGGGVITQIPDSHNVIVLCDDGFERKYNINSITHVRGEDYQLDDFIPKDEEGSGNEVDKAIRYKKQRRGELWEIDLHIESLVDSHQGWSNRKIVQTQLEACRQFIEKAQDKKIRNVVIIHGFGEGVLRSEVRSYLNQIEGAEYLDADYQEYGGGATQVILRYSY